MTLPFHHRIPVNLLAACFNNSSATYKYYWFISIIQAVERGETIIPKRNLFAAMITNAWYTVNYYHVSFGKQDKIQEAIGLLKNLEGITVDEGRVRLLERLCRSKNKRTIEVLDYFNNQVPHWFLSPWFPGINNKSAIYLASQQFENNCLYSIDRDGIRINPLWLDYLTDNSRLMKDFCFWNLALFLQSKNPNVPDIPNKLIRPITRNSLNSQRTKFWDIVITENNGVECIYTGRKLTIGDYAVEHFIPFNFVSHDLIWNLIPADRSFNSVKSDKLPPLDRYFEAFFKLQRQAVEIIGRVEPKSKFLQEYLTIYPDLDGVEDLPIVFTPEKFKERIQPMVTIAANNGFQFMQ